MKSAFFKLFVIVVTLSLFAPALNTAAAQRGHDDEDQTHASSSALVSGAYRVEVRQLVTNVVSADIGLSDVADKHTVVAIADITNTGMATTFDPAVISLGGSDAGPLQAGQGTSADSAATSAASQHLGFTTDGTMPVGENGTIRTALVFMLDEPIAEAMHIVRVGDQVMDVTNTISDSLDVAGLPALVPQLTVRVADVVNVDGDGKITVTFRDGGQETIGLEGISTPEQGSMRMPGCFYNESQGAVMGMSGGVLWLESTGNDGEYLAWINNASMGTFDLLNSRLVQEGFAGVDQDAQSSPYFSWLQSAEDYVKGSGLGLWATCKTAAGEWINEPTPAPEPTKSPAEERAEYEWINPLDLIIRPYTFEDRKIAVSGTVFNIQVDRDGAFMQIDVPGSGPGEAIILLYEGDTTGIYEGTWVTAYGEFLQVFEGTNLMGGSISQPVIFVDFLDW